MKKPKMSTLADPLSIVLRIFVWLATAVTTLVFLSIVGYILIKGLPNLTPSLFSFTYNSENVSLFPALINTFSITALSLLVAVPLGVFSVVYTVEYARRGNKLVKIVRMTAETLSGIPAIVYVLFGFLFFVSALGWSFSMLAGVFTLAIMILPLIMRTTEEALQSVPDSFSEGSFGLGAGRLRTVFKIVLPAAQPGIMAGVILSVGRIVGETAALIYTYGTVAKIPGLLMQSGRTLSVHMYALASEGLYIDQTYATAVVLLVIVTGINALSSYLARRLTRER